MQNHNEYLKQVETYLEDLPVLDRAKILSECHSEVINQETSDLSPSLEYANQKRAEHGFVSYKEKKSFSFMSFFFKFTLIGFLLLGSGVGFLIWKFYPILKVDEKNNRVIILGGLIDIDGEAGKMKVFDEYRFSQDTYTNDLQANLILGQEKDEIIINFNSGTFFLKNSNTAEVKLDCKLSAAAPANSITEEIDYIKIDLMKIPGVSCNVQIPIDKRITLEGLEGSVQLKSPEFNAYIELESGQVAIQPEKEIDYIYNLEVTNGYIGEFETRESPQAYEIQARIQNGSIVTR